MTDTTISRVRMRDLARAGRYRLATALPSRPGAASSRPAAGDLVASVI